LCNYATVTASGVPSGTPENFGRGAFLLPLLLPVHDSSVVFVAGLSAIDLPATHVER
jgi:hypothetical protein